MIPGAPKYSRVEIVFKENAGNRILNEIINSSKEPIEIFEDCGVMITGDFLLIILDNVSETPESIKYTKTHIFPLTQIEYYKIFNF
jgi:hypothetical protein